MTAMPIVGRLTDKIGAGRMVPLGIALALLGTIPFAEVSADTSSAWLAIALYVRGLGLGATMMPTFASAHRRLSSPTSRRACRGTWRR